MRAETRVNRQDASSFRALLTAVALLLVRLEIAVGAKLSGRF